MKVELVRHAYLHECTLGRLHVGNLTLATLEEPWIQDPDGPGGQKREPGKRESCVPDGLYTLHPHDGTTWKNVWCLESQRFGVFRYHVPPGLKYGRSAILIHSGSTTADILGCILVGLTHAFSTGQHSVEGSRIALDQLRAILGRATHQLQIRPLTGTTELQAA